MKEIIKETHIEIHPESAGDLKFLREEYQHLWPFDYVCKQRTEPVNVVFDSNQRRMAALNWECKARLGATQPAKEAG